MNACVRWSIGTPAAGFVGRPSDRSSGRRLPVRRRAGTSACVSVIDSKTQQPVRDLTADSVIVREDGTRREVLRVAPAQSPMSIAVIVDNSQAAMPTIPDLRQALTAFFKTIEAGADGGFHRGRSPHGSSGSTSSTGDLLKATGRLFHAPSSGATLLDTIADVSKGLLRRESDRAVIVVVTGENVEYGNLHYADVLQRLRESEAMLYAIVLVNPNGSVATDEGRNRATVLDRGPRVGRDAHRRLHEHVVRIAAESFGEMLKSQFRVTIPGPNR